MRTVSNQLFNLTQFFYVILLSLGKEVSLPTADITLTRLNCDSPRTMLTGQIVTDQIIGENKPYNLCLNLIIVIDYRLCITIS